MADLLHKCLILRNRCFGRMFHILDGLFHVFDERCAVFDPSFDGIDDILAQMVGVDEIGKRRFQVLLKIFEILFQIFHKFPKFLLDCFQCVVELL